MAKPTARVAAAFDRLSDAVGAVAMAKELLFDELHSIRKIDARRMRLAADESDRVARKANDLADALTEYAKSLREHAVARKAVRR